MRVRQAYYDGVLVVDERRRLLGSQWLVGNNSSWKVAGQRTMNSRSYDFFYLQALSSRNSGRDERLSKSTM